MQLIAIDGILSDFDFSGVGGHPIGIALTASFLKFWSVDPLIFFYWTQPLIAALCFIILYNLLTNVLEKTPAFFISLSSLGSLIMIKAMNQITAEVISLLTILLFISYVWEIIIFKRKNNKWSYFLMMLMAWLAILFRNASIFIIIGVLIFLFVYNKHGKIQLLIIGCLMLIPGFIKSFFYYDNPGYLDKILSLNMPLEIISQLIKHCMNLTEIILPYSLHLNGLSWLKLFLGLATIMVILYIIYINKDSVREKGKKQLLGSYFLTIGIVYYIFLSLSGIYYSYNWGDLYRVSGFGILFILCAFWIYIFSLHKRWSKYFLIILIITSISKISYGLRYEFISKEHRFLFNDYQETVANIVEFTNIKSGDLLIYTGFKWQGDNLFYILKYYDIIYSKPFNIKKYSREIEDTKSRILCTDFDLTKFESLKYKWSLIPNMDKVYLVELN